MLIRITKSAPGCTYQPGDLIKVPDKKAKHYIAEGFAQRADDAWDIVSVPAIQPKNTGNPYMLPPRHICGCGFVATSADNLRAHKRECK